MRALHWWGAAIGAGLLAASASSASPAFAGNDHHTQQASRADYGSLQVRTSHGQERGRADGGRDDRGHDGHGHDGHGKPCPYPPNGTPSVELSGPTVSRLGEWVSFTGKVSLNRCTYDSVGTALYVSRDGRHGWAKLGESSTDKDGSVTYGTKNSERGTWHLLLVVGAAGGLNAAYSDQLTLQVTGRDRH